MENGVAVQAMRTNRDCLFDGTGPDVSEENLAPLRKAVVDSGAAAGLATDGDADRFGIIDRDGTLDSAEPRFGAGVRLHCGNARMEHAGGT